jgi:succinyl-CoA synthetase beta subunit
LILTITFLQIAESGLRIFSVDELDQAASKAVQLSNIVKLARDANVSVKIEAN